MWQAESSVPVRRALDETLVTSLRGAGPVAERERLGDFDLVTDARHELHEAARPLRASVCGEAQSGPGSGLDLVVRTERPRDKGRDLADVVCVVGAAVSKVAKVLTSLLATAACSTFRRVPPS